MRRAYLLDAGLAVLLALASLAPGAKYFFPGPFAHKLLGSPAGGVTSWNAVTVIWWTFGALQIAALLLRRRWPVVALVLAVVGAAGHQVDGRFPLLPLDLAVPVVLYELASRPVPRWVPRVVTAVLVAGTYLVNIGHTVGPTAVPGKGTPTVHLPAGLSATVEPALVLLLALALGEGVRSRRAYLRTLERRAQDLERESRQRTALAAAAERARISRELHDVVAHALSVIVVQAQGAAAALRRHPERTEAALREVVTVGRSSLAEMRRLLGLVGGDDSENARLTPPCGLGDVPALVDQVRATGIPVRLEVEGEPVPLSATLDLSAYRIVQEALTNILKHADPGVPATVRVAFGAGLLAIDVTDEGTNGPATVREGNGLRGIAERTDLLGGRLSVGVRPEGGFRVLAELPIEPDAVGAAP